MTWRNIFAWTLPNTGPGYVAFVSLNEKPGEPNALHLNVREAGVNPPQVSVTLERAEVQRLYNGLHEWLGARAVGCTCTGLAGSSFTHCPVHDAKK